MIGTSGQAEIRLTKVWNKPAREVSIAENVLVSVEVSIEKDNSPDPAYIRMLVRNCVPRGTDSRCQIRGTGCHE